MRPQSGTRQEIIAVTDGQTDKRMDGHSDYYMPPSGSLLDYRL